jgi:hypothetical protein
MRPGIITSVARRCSFCTQTHQARVVNHIITADQSKKFPVGLDVAAPRFADIAYLAICLSPQAFSRILKFWSAAASLSAVVAEMLDRMTG